MEKGRYAAIGLGWDGILVRPFSYQFNKSVPGKVQRMGYGTLNVLEQTRILLVAFEAFIDPVFWPNLDITEDSIVNLKWKINDLISRIS
jgi:hypothetical protein